MAMQRSPAATKALTRGLFMRTSSKGPFSYRHQNLQVAENHIKGREQCIPRGNGVERRNFYRFMSSSASGNNKSGGGTKAVLVVGGAILSLVGVTLGYAGIDPDFRTYLESMIPGAKEAFQTVLGNTDQQRGESKSESPQGSEKKLTEIKVKTDKALPSKLKQITVEPDNALATSSTGSLEKTKKDGTESTLSGTERKILDTTPLIEPPMDVPPLVSKSPVNVKPTATAPSQPLPSTSHFPPPLIQVTPNDASKEEKIPKESTSVTNDASKVVKETPVKKEPLADISMGPEKESVMSEIEVAITSMKKLTEEAEKAGQSCQSAVETHSILVEKVLEKAVGDDDSDADDGTWKDVFEAANKKADELDRAQIQIKEAKSSIKRALEAVEKAKASEDPSTSKNPYLTKSDVFVNEALLRIQSVVEKLESATKDSKLVEEYRDLVEEGRQQFRKEIAALLPDSSPDGVSVRKGPLSQDELDVFVTHAYRKVCRLQQELAKQQTLAQQRLETSITDEQLRKQVVTEEVVQAELEAQRRLMEVEHQRKMAAIREEMENEVRSQLRRQAAAHSDHVKDVVDVETSELNRKHNLRIEEEISSERLGHQKELASITGRVEGLKTVVRQRADLELKIREAQELWLACKALSLALSVEQPPNGILPPLKMEVDAIERVANKTKCIPGGEENTSHKEEFVNAVLKSIPGEALARGVYTDESLRDRFFRVEKMAKRTALVKDGESSLLLYLLSYIQSFLLISPSTEKLPDVNEGLDIGSLSNVDVITLARGCVERGDITQAVRYMTLLKGEPANVSKDWIKEARLLLETRQACDALLAHAAAFGLETFPLKHNASPTGKSCCHGKGNCN